MRAEERGIVLVTVLLLALTNRNMPEAGDRQLAEFRSRDRLWSTPNLGLLTVAALLPDSFEITYVDQTFEAIPERGFTYVLLSPSTAQAPEAYRIADHYRRRGSRVLMGGPHVTVCPEEAARHADTVFVGESEELFPLFFREEQQGRAQKIYRARRYPPLESSLVPRYDLAVKYPYKSVPIQLSRGCPHQCRFCLSSKIYGKMVRRKTREQAKREIAAIRTHWKRPFLFFTDDNFCINPAYTDSILDILMGSPVDWYAFTDVSVCNKGHLLNKMAAAGCRKLLIGFESLSKNNLHQINASGFKETRLATYRTAVSAIQSRRIGVVGSFVLGLEDDTPETFERLYTFILDTCLYGTNITVSTPFPGTDMYRAMIESGVPLPTDWSLYDGFTLLHPLRHMTADRFQSNYRELLARLNSPERIRRIYQYFHHGYLKYDESEERNQTL